MRGIDQIRRKIEKIEDLLNSVKDDLERIAKKENKTIKKRLVEENLPNSEELRKAYNDLYKQFLLNEKSVNEFVNSKKKVYLNAFCKENSLPISKKASKKTIALLIKKWFAQKSAIMDKPIIKNSK